MTRFMSSGWSLAVLLASPISAQVTQRVSVSSTGTQATRECRRASVSADGRFVAFESVADNLVPGDTNSSTDVFVRDRQSGTTERVSLRSDGSQATDSSYNAAISGDGRFVVFMSDDEGMVPGGHNLRTDIYARDRFLGVTQRVSIGTPPTSDSLNPEISADGSCVIFDCGFRAWLRDLVNGVTEEISVDSNEVPGSDGGFPTSISADGRYVVFPSTSSDLVPGDTNGNADVFLRDRQAGTTELVSLSSSGTQPNLGAGAGALSSDARFVAFVSLATNLVPGATNGQYQVYVRDRLNSTTERVSLATAGTQADEDCYYPSISDDGRYVLFWSEATNLVPGDTNGSPDAFVRDRQDNTMTCVSVGSAGAPPGGSDPATASPDMRYVAFASGYLLPGDTNAFGDAYLHDRLGGPSFTTLCDPGVGGVIACPCGNPPSGPGRGCDNSAATGGAVLSATGGTYLSSDSLVFTTSGEKPTALSILSQWIAYNPSGAVFGQGVRCASSLRARLFAKSAVGGSITVPDFAAGDSTVSARSAAKGDPIQSGQTRWYLVYYRDNTVLGGCPPLTNFNSTQTGQVTWSP